MTTYVVCDIEADGPIPGPHSMISLGAVAVNNLEYEADLNEQKMQIRVLKPEFLNQFVREFTDLVREKE